MFLARALANGEGDLICDFAQTYHVLHWRSLGAALAATLAAGLPPGSRVMTRMAGATAPLPLRMQAMAIDYLALLAWQRTKDGQHGRNRPASVLQALEDPGQERKARDDLQAYDTPEEFWAARSLTVKGGAKHG